MTETLVPLSSRAKLTALEQAGFKRSCLARQVKVEYMTMYRWLEGKSEPHPRFRARIDALYRGHIGLLPLVESLTETRPDALELLRSRADLRERFLLEAVYHFQALGGGRLTLAETRQVLAARFQDSRAAVEKLAAINLRHGLLYLLEQAGSGFQITGEIVAELHRLVMRGIPDQRPARQDAEQRLTLVRMQAWLARCNLRSPHPVFQAARDHQEFERLRPFGGVSRLVGLLLLNAQLLSGGLPPALIRMDDQHDYESGLRQGDQGDFKPLERLVCESVLRGHQLLQAGAAHV